MDENLSKGQDSNTAKEAFANFYKNRGINNETATNQTVTTNLNSFNSTSQYEPQYVETDPDLMMTYEIVKLPSKGIFYKNKLSEVKIEYLTSRDEDLMTTPSFIEDNSMIDRLLERKIVNKDIKPKDLLSGDRNAILLFLRASSYGYNYNVLVTDPRTGNQFEDVVDLRKLTYKEMKEFPDQEGLFSVEIPMRKKLVKFRLLTSGEDLHILNNAEAIRKAYNQEVSEYNTLKLKASIVEINGKRDRNYIDKFVDVMPALDAFTIRNKIFEVSPDVDLNYEFKTKDGYKFKTRLSIGIDFFFPNR